MAEKILEDMLMDARWRNVMMLHEGVAVYEIRNGRGYGMRWTLDVERVGVQDGGRKFGEGFERTKPANGDEAMNKSDANLEDLRITKTTFRGFLEPIAGLDHELELEDQDEIKLS